MKEISSRKDYNKKNRCAVRIIFFSVFLSIFITMAYTRFTRQAMVKEYQNRIRVELSIIQIQLQEIIISSNKEEVPNLALDYERLGTVYLCASSSLFSSFYATGAWGDIARTLLGDNLSIDLFKAQEGALSENEIEFLKKLTDYNNQLLADISSDQSFRTICYMNAKTLQEVLNSHQNELYSFLYGNII